ncbi:hypothetical protein AUW17_02690 [Tenacibaculum dicentrarchi]|nr:hypothetical protein AUW17_02690 [Tenacibaculum dicentrarchi]
MKAIERVKQYISFKGFNNSSFEKKNNLSNGYIAIQIKRNADLGEGILVKILDNCLDMNPNWLLTGQGEMLRSDVGFINQNVTGSNVTMVGGSVVGGSVSTNNNENETMTLKNDLNACKKELKEKDEEIKRLKSQIDKLFKMIG